jgi:hypothetical protein
VNEYLFVHPVDDELLILPLEGKDSFAAVNVIGLV